MTNGRFGPTRDTKMTDIGQRKQDHIELCATQDVGFREKTTLFEHVRLCHDACPDLAWDEIDTSVSVLLSLIHI